MSILHIIFDNQKKVSRFLQYLLLTKRNFDPAELEYFITFSIKSTIP